MWHHEVKHILTHVEALTKITQKRTIFFYNLQKAGKIGTAIFAFI